MDTEQAHKLIETIHTNSVDRVHVDALHRFVDENCTQKSIPLDQIPIEAIKDMLEGNYYDRDKVTKFIKAVEK